MKLSIIFIISGIILGIAGGYTYWHFWGCLESCTITSSPFNSSVYGAIMGGLLGSMVKDYIKGDK